MFIRVAKYHTDLLLHRCFGNDLICVGSQLGDPLHLSPMRCLGLSASCYTLHGGRQVGEAVMLLDNPTCHREESALSSILKEVFEQVGRPCRVYS